MSTFDFKLEDDKRMRFVRVVAADKVAALLQAIKETNILNPTHVFQKEENGKFSMFSM